MKPAVRIRRFETSDLPGVLRIERESFDRDAWPRDVFVGYAPAAGDLFLVASVPAADAGSSVAGHSMAGYSITCLARHGAEIVSLAVRPRYRQAGIATELLKVTLKKARRAGAQAVWLMVRRENEKAIRLYRRFGFVRTATVPNYYDGRSPAWRMRVALRE